MEYHGASSIMVRCVRSEAVGCRSEEEDEDERLNCKKSLPYSLGHKIQLVDPTYAPCLVSDLTSRKNEGIQEVNSTFQKYVRDAWRVVPRAFCPVHKRIDLIDNHHGVRNPNPSLID
jgi:hypothetical protein